MEVCIITLAITIKIIVAMAEWIYQSGEIRLVRLQSYGKGDIKQDDAANDSSSILGSHTVINVVNIFTMY